MACSMMNDESDPRMAEWCKRATSSSILELEMQCKQSEATMDTASSLVQTICSLTVPTRHCVNVAKKAHEDATGGKVTDMEEKMIMLACGHM